MNTFHPADYVIFIAVFIASVGIGIYHGFFGARNDSPGAYLLGNRQMNLVPVTLSMIVTLLSGNTLLGTPAETYSYGLNISLKVVTVTIGSVVAAVLFVPVLFPLEVLSVNDYLEMRFRSVIVRQFGCILQLMSQVMYIGCVMVGAVVTLETSLPSWLALTIVTAVGTLYTAVGGLKGVIWTDVFQSVIMLLGIMVVLILGIIRVGSIEKVWSINSEWQRTKINRSVSVTERMNVLGFLIGYVFPWIAFYGISQTHVQRFNSMSTQSKACWSILLNPPGFAVFHLISVFIGMVMFAHYTLEGCDPISSKKISNPNQLLAYFVMDTIGFPGLPGAFVSALICAALSSQSSSLNSMAAVLWDDFLAHKFMGHWSKSKQAKFIKLLVLVFGVICGMAAYVILIIGGNLQQLAASLPGSTLGPMLGLFILGLINPYSNEKGALAGGVLALALNLWILSGQVIYKQHRNKLPLPTYNCTNGNSSGLMDYPLGWEFSEGTTSLSTLVDIADEGLQGPLKWLYSISFLWFGCIGTVVTFIIGTIVSALTGGVGEQRTPKRLLAPGIRNIFGGDSPGFIGEKNVSETSTDDADEKEALDCTAV